MSNINFKEVATHYCRVQQEAIVALPVENQIAFFEYILTREGMGAEGYSYIPDPDLVFMDRMEAFNSTVEGLEADSKPYSKACESYYSFLAMMDMDKFLSICKNGDRDIDQRLIEQSFQSEKTLESWRN